MPTKPKGGTTPWVDPDDAPELTAEHFERADVYEGETLVKRGRPTSSATGVPKKLVTFRLDQDVLDGLREMGPGWQTTVNERLREWVQAARRRTKRAAGNR